MDVCKEEGVTHMAYLSAVGADAKATGESHYAGSGGYSPLLLFALLVYPIGLPHWSTPLVYPPYWSTYSPGSKLRCPAECADHPPWDYRRSWSGGVTISPGLCAIVLLLFKEEYSRLHMDLTKQI